MREDDREVTLHISAYSVVRTIFIIAFALALWFLRDILLVVVTAVVVASALEPGTRWLTKHRVPRILAAVILYFFLALVILSIFYFFVPALWKDFVELGNALPESFQLGLWDPLQEGGTTKSVGDVVQQFFPGSVSGDVLNYAQSAVGGNGGDVFRAVSVFFGGILSFVLIVVLSFYLSAQERGLESFLKLASPKSNQLYIIDLWRRSQEKIGLWFQGQLLLGLLIGVLVFMGLAILGVPNPLFLALVAGMFELIPVFGPILSAVPAVLLGVTHGINHVDPGLTAGLIVAGFYTIIQWLENHLIYPVVVQKVVGVPPIVSILALVIGAKAAGFLGIILSVPVAAVIVEYLHDVAKTKNIIDADA